MKVDFSGAVALVTGASSGLGRELALQLAPRVRTLIVVARREARLVELRAELARSAPSTQVEIEAVDLSTPSELEALADRVLQRHGAVDILVNNAGLGSFGWFHEQDAAAMRNVIDVNVIATVLLTRRLLPKMVARRRGAILNVSSGAGLFPVVKDAVYSASKHFVNGFSESLRAEVAPHGVVVSVGCPGPADTEFTVAAGIPDGETLNATIESMRLSAQTSAREMLEQFATGRAVLLPGTKYRWFIRFGLAMPRALLRRGLVKEATALVQGERTRSLAGGVTKKPAH